MLDQFVIARRHGAVRFVDHQDRDLRQLHVFLFAHVPGGDRCDTCNLHPFPLVHWLPGHNDAVLNTEVPELICGLLNQLTTMRHEHGLLHLLISRANYVRADYGLASAGRGNDQK